jgi:hypothetical protein
MTLPNEFDFDPPSASHSRWKYFQQKGFLAVLKIYSAQNILSKVLMGASDASPALRSTNVRFGK